MRTVALLQDSTKESKNIYMMRLKLNTKNPFQDFASLTCEC